MSLRLALARVGFRWRLAAALGCLLLAAISALEDHAAPARAVTVRMVVAAHALPAGRVLRSDDLIVVGTRERWPGSTARVGALIGGTLAGPVARGEPVSTLRLADRSLTRGLPAQLVALPVDLGTDVRGLAAPGSRVDLFAVTADDQPADPSYSVRVAARVLVLAVLAPQGSDGGCRMVLALGRETAPRIAAARSNRLFQVAVLPP